MNMQGIALSRNRLLFCLIAPLVALGITVAVAGNAGVKPLMLPTSTNSSPIALTHDDRFLWVANPQNNSVTLMEVGGDVNRKLAEVPVGAEPQSVAITPDDRKVYVTNMVSGTVSVIDTGLRKLVRGIVVGAEPHGCALSPDGEKLYVANQSSDSLSIIDTTTDKVIETIPNIGVKPRGIAVTSDAGGNRVYITHFLAQLREDGRSVEEKEGRDDGKEGRVTFFNDGPSRVIQTIKLNPISDTGFKSDGSVLDRIGPDSIFEFTTGAFPNLLHSIVIKGNRAYLPNVGASPNGPVRFNVNVQGLLSGIDTADNTDVGEAETINMNRGVQFEPVGKRLFNTTPFAIAFKNGANDGYAVLAGVDRLVKVVLDADGTPTINAPTSATDPGNIVRIRVGKNPRGIAINSTDTRAYVMNFISRDVSVVDIQSGSPTENQVIEQITSAALPAPGTLAAIVHQGEELFNTSIGPPGTNDNALPPAGRMSDFGWGNCYNCHPSGLTDGVTWMFGDGPRQTISMESTAEHPQPPGSLINANGAPVLPAFKQRVLNWSAVRDEVQDFELNIRGVSGGQGLITDGAAVVNLTPTANTGRSADLDAIAAYISFGIRAPISPLSPKGLGAAPVDLQVVQGRSLFAAANCQSCHGGPNWTRSRVDFTPPPTETPVGGQLVRFLFNVGTFNPAAFNEVRPSTATPIPANGGLGFNIPSLASVFAGAPYLHSGSAPTLSDVLNNVTHRAAGTGGVDTLTNTADRAKLIKFLQSIDARTPTFP